MSQKNDEETGGVPAHAHAPAADNSVVDDGHDWQYDAVSNSSLTGEFTTITNVLDGHADGAGEQFYNPSRSTFEVVDVIDDYSMPRTSNDGSNIGSYDSYYHMQKNGPPFLAETDIRHHSIMRYGWRGGGMSGILTGSSLADTELGQEHFRDDASESKTNDRASSLSSLTNDFFPIMDRKGESLFSPKKNHKQLNESQGSNSPTSSNEKSSSQTSKIFPKALTPRRVKRNNLVHSSPWYVNKHHSDSPSPQNSSDQTPMTIHPHPPGEVLVAPSHKVSDSNPTPSVISSSNMSQYFSNELREMYNSNVYRSYRHRYNNALSSPKAKRIIISSVVLAAIFAIVAIIAICLGARSQNRSVNDTGASSYYDYQQNDGLPEKCCVGKVGLTEADMQERIEPTTGASKAPSPSSSPIQNTLNNLDWDYITLLTPKPAPGGDLDIAGSPNPTPGEDSIGWRPSIIPSWIPPAEKQIPIVATPKPSRRPTRKPSTQPSRSPTRNPSNEQRKQPTPEPTLLSTDAQTETPTRSPAEQPSSKAPTLMPTKLKLSRLPSESPTVSPNNKKPTGAPSPTVLTTSSPTSKPSTLHPAPAPTTPEPKPSPNPTTVPTTLEHSASLAKPPTFAPYPVRQRPTELPMPVDPTTTTTPHPKQPADLAATDKPTPKPTDPQETGKPTPNPTPKPTSKPTDVETGKPTSKPTTDLAATDKPTHKPAPKPSPKATDKPTPEPSPESVNCSDKYSYCTTISRRQVCCKTEGCSNGIAECCDSTSDKTYCSKFINGK